MKKGQVTLMLGCFILIFMILAGCSKDSPHDTPPIKEPEPKNNPSNHAQPESFSPQKNMKVSKDLLMQKQEPTEIHIQKEEYLEVLFPVKSRYGTMILQSDGEALLQMNSNIKRYSGTFRALGVNGKGEKIEIDKFTDYLQEDVKAWKWDVIEFEEFDLFILKTDQREFYRHAPEMRGPMRNIRGYIATKNNDVFPLRFLVNTQEGEIKLEELTVHSDYQPSKANGHLRVFSSIPEVHELAFEIDLDQKMAKLVEAENINEAYLNAQKLAEEQARILEVILFYGVGDSQQVIDATEESWKKLLKRVSKQASRKESFKYVTQNKKKYGRPFYWGTSDIRMDELNKELYFTFSANLIYAAGQDLRLQVHMTQNNGTWQFENFGSLYVEEFENFPRVIIEDDIIQIRGEAFDL